MTELNEYYYKYNKRDNTLTLVVGELNSSIPKEVMETNSVYCTYTYDNPAEALVDIMDYLNKRNLNDTINLGIEKRRI